MASLWKKRAGALAGALLLAVSPMTALADVGTLPAAKPSEIAVDWYTPGTIGKVEQGETTFSFTVPVNGTQETLTLSFPEEGGVRLHSSRPGFFVPASLLPVRYQEEAGGALTMTGGDAGVTLVTEGDGWILYFLSAGGQRVHEITSEQIRFGYADGELKKVALEGPIHADEVLYGLGERFNALDQVGSRVLLWNQDGYEDLMPFDGDKTVGYKNVPLVYSSRGYTLFFNSTYSAVADMGKTDESVYSLDFNGPKFDLYLWTGTPRENLASYTALTGTALLPPKWAFSYSCGISADLWDPVDSSGLERVRETVEKYRQMGTPPSAFFCPGQLGRDPAVYSLLKQNGIRVHMWYFPPWVRRRFFSICRD